MLYLLDEPTTGLHLDDVKKLLLVLHRLVDAGNTVVLVEHHLDVVRAATGWWTSARGRRRGREIVAEAHPRSSRRRRARTPGSSSRRLLPRTADQGRQEVIFSPLAGASGPCAGAPVIGKVLTTPVNS